MDIDFNYVRFNTYADCLKSLGEKHSIVQEKDMRTNKYIFRKKGQRYENNQVRTKEKQC